MDGTEVDDDDDEDDEDDEDVVGIVEDATAVEGTTVMEDRGRESIVVSRERRKRKKKKKKRKRRKARGSLKNEERKDVVGVGVADVNERPHIE